MTPALFTRTSICPNVSIGPAGHRVDTLEIPDVGAEGQRLAAEAADGVGGRLGGRLLEVDRDDVRAGPRQRQRRRAADAARGAGDDRDPIGERLTEVDHRYTPGGVRSSGITHFAGRPAATRWMLSKPFRKRAAQFSQVGPAECGVRVTFFSA